MREMQTVTHMDIMNYGYPEGTARRVIREGKKLLVQRGFLLYKNKRIGRIPKSIAEEILGFKIMSKDVIIDDVLLSPDIERGK
jgi:hypothetical protein